MSATRYGDGFLRWGAGLVVLALTWGCGGAAYRAAHRFPELEPCRLEGAPEKLLCGSMPVFEDREAQAGRRIALRIVVAPARTSSPAPDPLFYFMGGPGGAATEAAPWLLPAIAGVRRQRDVVFVDQRGTGSSNRLDCDLPGDAREPQGLLGEMLPPPEIERCKERLEQRADLTLYTTSIAMDDIDEVRRRLGYERINLYGGSYGTRAAQVFIRQHASVVRSAVLAGSVPMDEPLPVSHARGAQRSIDLLFEACRQDEACHAAFPDPAAQLAEILERVEEAPVRVQLPKRGDREAQRVLLGRSALAEGLRFQLYDASSAVRVPALIDAAHRGDFVPLTEAVISSHGGLRRGLSYGMFLSVTCAEDMAFIEPGRGEVASAGTFLGNYRVAQQREACRLWPRAAVEPGFHRAVDRAVPVLLLSGELDPVTPPAWGEEVSSHLPDSLHVVVPHGHHGFGGLEDGDCSNRLITRFIEQGSSAGLDASCVEGMRRIPFVLALD